jgi:hypothetical protein
MADNGAPDTASVTLPEMPPEIGIIMFTLEVSDPAVTAILLTVVSIKPVAEAVTE